MRLNQYLTEDESVDKINSIIQRSCKPYLALIKGKMPLYRGLKRADTAFGKKDVRQDRRPRGMDKDTADQLNNWLEANNHNKRENTVICTSNEYHIEQFGDAYMIFPIGPISYTWFDGNDMNQDEPHTGWDGIAPKRFFYNPDFDDNYRTKLSKPFKEYFHTDEGFDIAYKKGYEMWIKCKQYYFMTLSPHSDYNTVWDEKYQVFV